MAEDKKTNIKTPAEVADSFGKQESTVDESIDIDINEELARMNARFTEMENKLRDAELVASQANALAEWLTPIIQNNAKNIDVIDSAIKNTKGATPSTKVSFDSDGSLIIDGGGGAFSGVAYVSGRKMTGLTAVSAYPWVKIDVSDGSATEEAGPPSNPFPPNEEWYEKEFTIGDIHVTRL